ncbi:MAG: YkgJ family cysteine cluster protein [Alphaproteobacteria bacterium]|nr:YkgJ family cysteine cluster protein [Alphaproteobacteria bacterium]
MDAPSPAVDADAQVCLDCGACCRQAFHVVEVEPDDPFAVHHGALLVAEDGRLVLPRPGGFCAALRQPAVPFLCRCYDHRPESCRDFPVGGESCALARKRVGLAPLSLP